MTREDIILMMRDACDKDKVDAWENGFWTITQEELERFAQLIAADAIAKEREACAKLCEEANDMCSSYGLAKAIRQRGNK